LSLQSAGGKIIIGTNTTIGDFCSLYGQGSLKIGNDVMIASCVQIVPNQHTFSELALPISRQPCQALGIQIHDECWIGTNTVILDGVEIGRGAIVGAGSVVTRNVPPYAIVAGVPSKILRFRPGYTQETFDSGII
jgi:acetyltransferase-like isoleucine patch superfamily enzyme